MEGFTKLFESLGANGELIIAVGASVYLFTGTFRAKLPKRLTYGWRSDVFAVLVAVLMTLSALALPEGESVTLRWILSIFTTALFGWLASFVAHNKFKGTKFEIKAEGARNGRFSAGGSAK